MSLFTLPVLEAEFSDDGSTVAQGADVYAQDSAIAAFLNSGNIDSTNLSMSATYPWTGPHSFTVSNTGVDNVSAIIGGVMASNKYGMKVSSAVAQTNSALAYFILSHASSTVPVIELSNAGTGPAFKPVCSAIANAIDAQCTSTSNTAGVNKLTQAGTGPLIDGTLRTFSGLNAGFTAKVLTTAVTVSNSATETEVADLTCALPANFLKIGTTIRGKICGTIDSPGSGPATVQFKLKYGSASGLTGTTLLSSSAFTPTTSLANSYFEVDFTLTCITVGGTGTISPHGYVMWNSNTIPVMQGLGTGATGAGNSADITVDTTAASDLYMTVKMGSAVSGSVVRVRAGHVELLK